MKPVCVISVISDVWTDQRILRTVEVLQEMGYQCNVIGRKTKKNTNFSSQHFSEISVFHINPFFQKGVFMYLFFNVLLLFRLTFLVLKNKVVSSRRIIFYANDLDTLLPNYIVSKLFYIPLVYDSHELFTEVPELQTRKFKKSIWETIEKYIVPKLKFAITVNQSIAEWYSKKYAIPFCVVRNISKSPSVKSIKSRQELALPENKHIIILQGTGINIHRGAEELVQAMQYLSEDYLLLIIGGGDVIENLKQMIRDLNIQNKVWLKDRMPADELYHYTANATIGISIDKPNNLNYWYSLPNKIFSYIQAHIPIISSRLPEIEKIIQTYQIGMFIEHHDPQHLAEIIHTAVHHKDYALWKANTYKAAKELNWEREKVHLKSVLEKYINT